MSKYDAIPPRDLIKDKDTDLGHDAANAQDRWDALQWCLNHNWNGLDIGRLERSDTDTFHGWSMWLFIP